MVHSKNGPDEKEKFVPVLLDVVIRFAHLFDFSFYVLKPNGEFVEISVDKKLMLKTMEGYRTRGMEEIFLKEGNYHQFVTGLRQYLDDKASFKATLSDMELIYRSVKHQMVHVGMDATTIQAAEDVNKMVMGQITKVPTLTQLLLDFKQNSPSEFKFYIVLSYVATTMVSTFSWKSEHIKIKVGMVAMLCDLMMKPEDFQTMKDKAYDEWPDKLKIYPVHNASKLLALHDKIPAEVIQMIEMHRELPGGDGFPRKLKHTAIPLLPAIFIVAYNFVDRMYKSNLDPEKVEEIMSHIYQDFSKGSFHLASLSIFETIGTQLPH